MATVLEPRLVRGPARESSDRSFGLVFAAVFALIGCWPLLHGRPPRWWALGVAIAFAAGGSRCDRKSCIRSTGRGSRSGCCFTRW